MGYRQVMILRKDILKDCPGKAIAMGCHCAMAFLTNKIRQNSRKVVNEDKNRSYTYEEIDGKIVKKPMLYRRDDLSQWAEEAFERGDDYFYTKPVNTLNPYGRLELCEPTYYYKCNLTFDQDLYEQWIEGSFVKTVCEARNKNHLLKVKVIAEELGLVEGADFGEIRDNCLTVLSPEDNDGRTLVGIWFKPLPDEIAHKISKKYQLYK